MVFPKKRLKSRKPKPCDGLPVKTNRGNQSYSENAHGTPEVSHLGGVWHPAGSGLRGSAHGEGDRGVEVPTRDGAEDVHHRLGK